MHVYISSREVATMYDLEHLFYPLLLFLKITLFASSITVTKLRLLERGFGMGEGVPSPSLSSALVHFLLFLPFSPKAFRGCLWVFKKS